jgi:hypothetical protein
MRRPKTGRPGLHGASAARRALREFRTHVAASGACFGSWPGPAAWGGVHHTDSTDVLLVKEWAAPQRNAGCRARAPTSAGARASISSRLF